jgi:hypothetical protein
MVGRGFAIMKLAKKSKSFSSLAGCLSGKLSLERARKFSRRSESFHTNYGWKIIENADKLRE